MIQLLSTEAPLNRRRNYFYLSKSVYSVFAMGSAKPAVLALFLLCGYVAPAVDAQSVSPELAYFDHITREDGLTNTSVSSIIADSYGFLWFGTQSGLNRYDGRTFRLYEHLPFDENSLSHNLIQTMYEDPEQPVLWIGTYQGLSRFDMETRDFTNFTSEDGQSSLSNGVVTAIVRDPADNVWVGTLDGLNRLDPQSGEIERVGDVGEGSEAPQGLPDQTVRSLHIGPRGRVWIGTYGGLSVMDPDTGSLRTVVDSNRLEEPAVMDIIDGSAGSLWLAVWDTGIVRYDIEEDHLRTYPLSDTRVYTLASKSGRFIFAGTWGGGLYRLDSAVGSVTNFRHGLSRDFGLSHDTVYSLTFDQAGVLWIGTNGGGVNRFSERRTYRVRFEHDVERKESLSNGNVTAVTRDSHGTLWIGTYNGGLNRYDAKEDRMVHYRADGSIGRSITNDIVTSVFEDSAGNLWVGTNGGLNRYDRASDRFLAHRADAEDPDSIPGDIIYAFEEESENLLWIGTYSAGVFLWDTEEGMKEHFPHDPANADSISDNLIYDIHKAEDGTVWVATNRGLNRFDRDSRTWDRFYHEPSNPDTLGSNTCRVVFEASDGTIWVGTSGGGLNRHDPEGDVFRSYTRRDGLSSNTVNGILEDGYGRLWLATSNGISVLNPGRDHVRNLDERDGIGGMEFTRATMLDGDGSLWFGGAHGVTVLDGPIRDFDGHPPKIHITGVSVLGEPIEPDGVTFNDSEIRLKHDERSVSFEFIALDYASPEDATYRFKLEGFDDSWTDADTRNYTNYTRLPRGEYTFTVTGAAGDGAEAAAPAEIRLIVEPSPWQTWWAITGYVLLGLFLLYVTARLRERQVLARRVVELDSQRNELEQVNRTLGEISVKDGLTGLFNRRYFDLKLADAFSAAKRAKTELSLIMIDIDEFKRYNDLYGHIEGDTCLKTIAAALPDTIERGSDFVSRYGGEEFAVLLFDTDCGGAERVSERIRETVQQQELAFPDSPVASVVTISTGFCSMRPQEGLAPEELVRRADEALYRAKRAGRNTTRGCPSCEEPRDEPQ
ncbi:MAG: ligand-binding sensor domain-containing diguanylate cyclase [Spirochaetota bacterium]